MFLDAEALKWSAVILLNSSVEEGVREGFVMCFGLSIDGRCLIPMSPMLEETQMMMDDGGDV